MKRHFIVFCLITAFATTATAQTGSKSELTSGTMAQVGVAVENVRLEQDGKVAFVRVMNQSTKDVTAFNLTVDVVFANGRPDHFEHATDFVDQIISTGSGAIRLGNRYEVRLDFSDRVSSVDAKPDVVVYADLSTDINRNQDGLDRIVTERRNAALAAGKAAEIISEAAANSVTPDPRGMALRQLRLLADKAKNSPDMSEIELRTIIADLENQAVFPRKDVSPRDALKAYASDKTKDAEIKSAHSVVRRAQ